VRCALVHDWLTGYRGGEKVLEVFCDILPDADIYTMIYHPGTITPAIEEHRITPSWLNQLPGGRKHYRYLLPLMPAVAQRFKVSGYDLVIAINHCVAQGVDASDSGKLISYCLTPMRYAWDMLDSYFTKTKVVDPRYWALKALRGYLKRWDRRAAERVTEFVTDCANIRERVQRCYGRDSQIIYPPVDTNYYQLSQTKREDFYLWVGAMAPYKRIDLALEAFSRLGKKLVIIGEGQDAAWARKAGAEGVTFLGRQPDEVLLDHYARCRALVFPGEEDFGIVPLEAQACGCPVIAYGKGGALETVVDVGSTDCAPTGLYFYEPTVESLIDAIKRFEECQSSFAPDAVREHALGFSYEKCADAFRALVSSGNGDRET
jgi:glycosyltransferase involved in cell wall biosynthesis